MAHRTAESSAQPTLTQRFFKGPLTIAGLKNKIPSNFKNIKPNKNPGTPKSVTKQPPGQRNELLKMDRGKQEIFLIFLVPFFADVCLACPVAYRGKQYPCQLE